MFLKCANKALNINVNLTVEYFVFVSLALQTSDFKGRSDDLAVKARIFVFIL